LTASLVATGATSSATNAGGPPAELLDRLGAKVPVPGGAAATTATGAINAGGPPAELLSRLNANTSA
ncbi:MAG TPA: hypothetical protein VFX76_01615, partial [Roseiflexaceae bacterium]|nr:hypothetical protein [Roseiflexaceae bacterium]